MDFKVINKSISVAETLYDGFDERPVDSDFVLPDYYPDIAAVLKCTLKPVIQSKQLSGDRFIVDGIAVMQVLYLDEARQCVRSCEFSKPFTSTFAVKSGANNPMIRVSAKTDYVNCRAVSPRRLDVHGAFSVKMKMQAESGNDVISAIHGDSMYTRRNVVTYSVPAMSAEKSFTISEVLELGQGKPAAESLVRGDAVATISDCKLLNNKVIIKGELILGNLYVSNTTTGETQKVHHEIPFSQIIDIDGLDEEWQCDIHMDIVSSDIHISTNQNGEGRLMDVNMKLVATVQCFKTGMAEIVSDSYSTRCPMRLESKRLETEHLMGIQNDTSMVREKFDLPADGVASIMDIWCEVMPVSEACEKNRSLITGRMMIYMLAKDMQGLVAFYERPADFTLEFEDQCSSVSSDMTITQLDYSLLGSNQVEIKAAMNVVRRCFSVNSMMAVSSAFVDESASFPEEKSALKIYFANGGESVWEVAKACHTSMDAVMEENSLNSDVLAKDTMLLVPLC